MKTLSAMCIAVVLLAAGCKKDPGNNNTPKTYLVSKITYNATYNDNSKKTFVDEYTYDSQNRLIAFNSQFDGVNYKCTYNNNNSLATVIRNYPDGSNYSVSTYTYSGNTVRDSVNILNGDNINIGFLTLNAKGQVATFQPGGVPSVYSYTYDSSGNVVGFDNEITPTDHYTYDNKKNPFSMLGAPNLDMVYFSETWPQTNVNNPLTSESGSTTYAYTYNSAGFPATATVAINEGLFALNYTATYEYIVK